MKVAYDHCVADSVLKPLHNTPCHCDPNFNNTIHAYIPRTNNMPKGGHKGSACAPCVLHMQPASMTELISDAEEPEYGHRLTFFRAEAERHAVVCSRLEIFD